MDAPSDFEFLTSDVPIVKIVIHPKFPRMYAGGWLSPHAETTFTLDPKTCLVISPEGFEGQLVGKRSWCKDVNRRLIMKANRFVISREKESFVEKVATKRNDKSNTK